MDHLSSVHYSRPYLTDPQIQNITTQSGVDSLNGKQLRVDGFELTLRVCKALNLPIRSFDIAMMLYLSTLIYSSTKIHFQPLVGACVLLGMKMQDTPKKSRDLAAEIVRAQNKQAGAKEMEDFRALIAAQEQQVLETIAFDLRGENPHYYTIKLSKQLKVDREVARTAWTITTDMYLTWSPLRQPPHTLALAAIILAAKLHDVKHIFPIDSPSLLSSRPAVNECLADILTLYIENYRITCLSKGDEPRGSTEIFRSIASPIRNELEKVKPGGKLEGLLLNDPKITMFGTAEYILFKP